MREIERTKGQREREEDGEKEGEETQREAQRVERQSEEGDTEREAARKGTLERDREKHIDQRERQRGEIDTTTLSYNHPYNNKKRSSIAIKDKRMMFTFDFPGMISTIKICQQTALCLSQTTAFFVLLKS